MRGPVGGRARPTRRPGRSPSRCPRCSSPPGASPAGHNAPRPRRYRALVVLSQHVERADDHRVGDRTVGSSKPPSRKSRPGSRYADTARPRPPAPGRSPGRARADRAGPSTAAGRTRPSSPGTRRTRGRPPAPGPERAAQQRERLRAGEPAVDPAQPSSGAVVPRVTVPTGFGISPCSRRPRPELIAPTASVASRPTRAEPIRADPVRPRSRGAPCAARPARSA